MSATTRLPIPSGDSGNWGTILNDFVSQSTIASTTASADNGLLKEDHAAITKGGKVGIGTSAPIGKLQVVGDLLINGTTSGCWFNYGTNEDIYIRPGKAVGVTYIERPQMIGTTGMQGTTNGCSFNNGVNEDIYIRPGKPVGAILMDSFAYLSITGNTLLSGSSATGSNFNFGATEDTAIRSGKTTGTVFIQDVGGKVIMGLPTFADEAAATTGGAVTNQLYKTATGEIRIKL
jgi:hypothetical protein